MSEYAPDIPNEKTEGQPCFVIYFEVCQHSQVSQKIKVDIVGCDSIKHLKEDNAELFKIPEENQVWFYNGIEMKDEETLLEYLNIIENEEVFSLKMLSTTRRAHEVHWPGKMISSGHHESVPCIAVKFEVQRGNQIYYYDVDLVASYIIEGLKEDNADLFKIPSQNQVWTNQGVQLEDLKLLADYFDITDGTAKTIVVKNSNE